MGLLSLASRGERARVPVCGDLEHLDTCDELFLVSRTGDALLSGECALL